MNLTKPKNSNYCAVVVKLKSFEELKKGPGGKQDCDNVKATVIFGNSVIVSKDTAEGEIGLFFPAETQLGSEFLGENNLYRKTEFGNKDPKKVGFFEQHGRVKTMKFRGHRSEGLWIPIASVSFTGLDCSEFSEGMEFDTLEGVEICRKYAVPRNQTSEGKGTPREKRLSSSEVIKEGQFRHHYETLQLGKNSYRIRPDSLISITHKLHGTSAVFSNLLVNRQLFWYEKLAKKLGLKVREQEYAFIWSSRRVIKGIEQEINTSNFYKSDVWGEVGKGVKPVLAKGITVYGEIVGYTPDGAYIQKKYDYGCEPKTHRFYVYRVTSTNEDGEVIEFSWPQVKEFCVKKGLRVVPEYFFGFAQVNCGVENRDSDDGFGDIFFKKLHGETQEKWCKFCLNEVPAEGFVVRLDGLNVSEAYKVKSFAFQKFETEALDAGVVDTETEECV